MRGSCPLKHNNTKWNKHLLAFEQRTCLGFNYVQCAVDATIYTASTTPLRDSVPHSPLLVSVHVCRSHRHPRGNTESQTKPFTGPSPHPPKPGPTAKCPSEQQHLNSSILLALPLKCIQNPSLLTTFTLPSWS